MQEVIYQDRVPAWYKVNQVLWYLLYLVEIVLTLRFAFRALGSGGPFARFVYNITQPIVSPFRGTVGSSVSNNSVIEWSTLVAMAILWLAVWAITSLLRLAAEPSNTYSEYSDYDNSQIVMDEEAPRYFEDDKVTSPRQYRDYGRRPQYRL